jgi:hypothetical protein
VCFLRASAAAPAVHDSVRIRQNWPWLAATHTLHTHTERCTQRDAHTGADRQSGGGGGVPRFARTCSEWNVPFLPVKPWQMTLVVLSTKTAGWCACGAFVGVV